MQNSLMESLRKTYSTKRMSENDSVVLLERNLNSLKKQFVDLEYKLKTDQKPAPFSLSRGLIENKSCISELNTKLFIEKENLEKKTISTMCENVKLEEKVQTCKLKNNILNRELERELNVNKLVINENLNMKQNMEQLERQNCYLEKKLDNLKTEVKIFEEIEARKSIRHAELQEECDQTIQQNKILAEKLSQIEKENSQFQFENALLIKAKNNLEMKNDQLQMNLKEKENEIVHIGLENERHKQLLGCSQRNYDVLERHHQSLGNEKNNLYETLSKSYRQETELQGEVALLKAKIHILERRNNECVDQLWKLTK